MLPPVESEVRLLGAPVRRLDEATQQLLEGASQEAYEQGCRDGAARATAAVEAAAARVVGLVERLDADLRGLAARVDADLAVRIAAAVLGREPADDSDVLLRRVEEALAALDDDPLTVHVNAEDLGPLAAALAAPAATPRGAVRVVADPAVRPGEARITGRWAHADLTRRGAWEAVTALLGEDAG